MEFTGRVIKCLTPQSGVSKSTGKEWTSQSFVVEIPGAFPKKVCFDIFGQERLLQTTNVLQEGNDVTVSIDIDAHEYNGRWFNSIRAWKVELAGAQNAVAAPQPAPVQPVAQPVAAPQPAPIPQPVPAPTQAPPMSDELPF